MKLATLALSGASLLFAMTANSQAPSSEPPNPWGLDLGLNYVTGDFGFEQDTDVWLQMTTIHYEQDPLHIQVGVPFVSISGPASVIGDVGRPTTATERGLGDLQLAATYKFLNHQATSRTWTSPHASSSRRRTRKRDWARGKRIRASSSAIAAALAR